MPYPIKPLPTLRKLLSIALAAVILGACGYSDELHQRHSLLKLLWNERYAELDGAITQAYVEKGKGKLSSNQIRSRFWQLEMVDPAFTPRFDGWVAKQDSSHAYLARGWFRLEQAQKTRGEGPYRDISPDRRTRVQELVLASVEDFHQALKKDPLCAMCVGGKIAANRYLGRRDPELIETALSIDPKLWQPVAAHFISLYPQWGGSEDEMKAFIRRMETVPGAEKSVRHLNAMFHFRRGLDHQYDTMNYPEAIKEYETAISYHPDSNALKNIAQLYSRQRQYDKAASALERNLHENDEWDLYTIEALAQAYFAQGKQRDGEKMMNKRDELIRRFRNGE
ncbi:MAG TPA: hypothetical protein V6D19_08220 [Stenomitos sp.]